MSLTISPPSTPPAGRQEFLSPTPLSPRSPRSVRKNPFGSSAVTPRPSSPSQIKALIAEDPLLANLTPISVSQMSADDNVNFGSPQDREVGIWAAVARQKIEDWVTEVDRWESDSSWERQAGKGFLIPDKATRKRRKLEISKRAEEAKNERPVNRRLFDKATVKAAAPKQPPPIVTKPPPSPTKPNLPKSSAIDELLSPTSTPMPVAKRLEIDIASSAKLSLFSGLKDSPDSGEKAARRRSIQIGSLSGYGSLNATPTPTPSKRTTVDFSSLSRVGMVIPNLFFGRKPSMAESAEHEVIEEDEEEEEEAINETEEEEGEKFFGSLPFSLLSHYDARIEEITSSIQSLDIETLKSKVLSYRTSSSGSSLSDSEAIITSTTLQLLPPLNKLSYLLEIWSRRIEVCRVVPTLLSTLEDPENIILGKTKDWMSEYLSISDEEYNEEIVKRLDETFETLREEVEKQVVIGGKIVDGMLDMLDGKEETIPDEWIDRLEKLEGGLADWMLDQESRVWTLKRDWEVRRNKRLDDEMKERQRLEEERQEKERQRLEAERLEKERIEKERLEAERLEQERLEQERLEAERLEAERLERERLEAERIEAERMETDRLEAERLEKERLETERLEAERLEQERLEKERLENEQLEREKLEAELNEIERLEAEGLEQERLEKERLELETERVENEKREAERLEEERIEKEQTEAAAKLEAERLAKEQAEAEVIERQRGLAEATLVEEIPAESTDAVQNDGVDADTHIPDVADEPQAVIATDGAIPFDFEIAIPNVDETPDVNEKLSIDNFQAVDIPDYDSSEHLGDNISPGMRDNKSLENDTLPEEESANTIEQAVLDGAVESTETEGALDGTHSEVLVDDEYQGRSSLIQIPQDDEHFVSDSKDITEDMVPTPSVMTERSLDSPILEIPTINFDKLEPDESNELMLVQSSVPDVAVIDHNMFKTEVRENTKEDAIAEAKSDEVEVIRPEDEGIKEQSQRRGDFIDIPQVSFDSPSPPLSPVKNNFDTTDKQQLPENIEKFQNNDGEMFPRHLPTSPLKDTSSVEGTIESFDGPAWSALSQALNDAADNEPTDIALFELNNRLSVGSYLPSPMATRTTTFDDSTEQLSTSFLTPHKDKFMERMGDNDDEEYNSPVSPMSPASPSSPAFEDKLIITPAVVRQSSRPISPVAQDAIDTNIPITPGLQFTFEDNDYYSNVRSEEKGITNDELRKLAPSPDFPSEIVPRKSKTKVNPIAGAYKGRSKRVVSSDATRHSSIPKLARSGIPKPRPRIDTAILQETASSTMSYDNLLMERKKRSSSDGGSFSLRMTKTQVPRPTIIPSADDFTKPEERMADQEVTTPVEDKEMFKSINPTFSPGGTLRHKKANLSLSGDYVRPRTGTSSESPTTPVYTRSDSQEQQWTSPASPTLTTPSSPDYDSQDIHVLKRKPHMIGQINPRVVLPKVELPKRKISPVLNSPDKLGGFLHPSTPPAKSIPHESLEEKIEFLLKTLPTKVKLTPSPMKPKGSFQKKPHGNSKLGKTEPAVGKSNIPAPNFGITRSETETSRRRQAESDNSVKMYHLQRPNGESPVKLFLRVVGERGASERVMVRVGGGWADLGAYLREYAIHHGSQHGAKSATHIEFGEFVPSKALRPSNSNSSLRSSGMYRRSPTPSNISRPNSPSPSASSAMPGSESPIFLSSSGGAAARRASDLESPTYSSASPLHRSSINRGSPTTPTFPDIQVRSPGSHDRPSSRSSITRIPTSRLSYGESPTSRTDLSDVMNSPPTPLGLAGPKSKKREISAEKQAWVDRLEGQVRKVSAERSARASLQHTNSSASLRSDFDNRRESGGSSIGNWNGNGNGNGNGDVPEIKELGKVGSTRRVYHSGARPSLGAIPQRMKREDSSSRNSLR